MPLTEETPLLVDPPIDDESFRHESRSFPSVEQKHLIFSAYSVTSVVSRFSELSATYLIAISFPSNLIATTLYSFLLLAISASSERLMIKMARMVKSRLFLLKASIVQQRVSTIVFVSLLFFKKHITNGLVNLVVVSALALCIIWLKASLYLYQLAYRADWLNVLANAQENVRIKFEKTMHGFTVMTLLLLPIFVGLLGISKNDTEFCNILIFTVCLGFLIEISLIYKLYNSCFALYLDRNILSLDTVDCSSSSVDLSPMIGVLTTPTAATVRPIARYASISTRPISKIYRYALRKPVPVAVTFGAILINTSLLTVGPHMFWFYLKMNMSPLAIGLIKVIQTLITLHPSLSAQKSFISIGVSVWVAVGCLYAALRSEKMSQWWLCGFTAALITSRAGVPTINLIGEQFVEDYLGDEEVHKVYKENAVWLRTQCELSVHILFILWPQQKQFLWPITASASITICGMAIMLIVITKHLATIHQ